MADSSDRTGLRLLVVGDSLSEGVGDPAPSLGWLSGRLHGWVYHLEQHIGRSRAVETLNLARRGATLRDVADLQLPRIGDAYHAAICLVGVNDALSPGFAGRGFAGRYRVVIGRLREVAPVVVVGTIHDITRPLPIPAGRKDVIRRRIAAVNAVVREVAEDPGTLLADFESHQDEITRPLLSIDRLHPNRDGHRQLAHRMVALMEANGVLEPGAPPAPRGSGSRVARLTGNARHIAWITLHSAGPLAVEAARRAARRARAPRRSP